MKHTIFFILLLLLHLATAAQSPASLPCQEQPVNVSTEPDRANSAHDPLVQQMTQGEVAPVTTFFQFETGFENEWVELYIADRLVFSGNLKTIPCIDHAGSQVFDYRLLRTQYSKATILYGENKCVKFEAQLFHRYIKIRKSGDQWEVIHTNNAISCY